jgi:hypothetical protein
MAGGETNDAARSSPETSSEKIDHPQTRHGREADATSGAEGSVSRTAAPQKETMTMAIRQGNLGTYRTRGGGSRRLPGYRIARKRTITTSGIELRGVGAAKSKGR